MHLGIDDLDDNARQAVNARLLLVASQVRHQSAPMAHNDLAECGAMPTCLKEHMARGSIITYSHTMPGELINEGLTQDERRVKIVHKAFILLHEFAHALYAWRFGHDNEDFFEGSTIAEAGFELEARLVGGVPCIRTSRHGRRYLVVGEWPSVTVTDGYDLPSFCIRPRELPVGRSAKEWKVPIPFIRGLVDDEYWDDADGDSLATSLIPEPLANTVRACLNARCLAPPVPESIAALFA